MLVLCLFVVLAALFITVLNSKTAQQFSMGGQAVNTYPSLTGSSASPPATTLPAEKDIVESTPTKNN
jgi:hypothetical protein